MGDNGFASAKHFVLIHGACNGAWCWYKLQSLLKQAGHTVTALDLAASGRNLERIEDVPTIDDYHKPLFSFMEELSAEDKIILVGHSMGGYAVSSAMERFPEKIAFAVFVSALMLGPHLTLDQINDRLLIELGPDNYEDSEQKIIGEGGDSQTIILFGNNLMAQKQYNTSLPEDLELAELLIRPSKFFNDNKSKKQLLVSKEKYGLVRSAYIGGGSDLGVTVDVQKWMIENNLPEVVMEIKGADHMVMISKTQELCNNLLNIAQKVSTTYVSKL